MKSWKIVFPALLLMCSASLASAATMDSGSSEMKGHFTLSGVGGITVPSGKLSADYTDDGADMGMGWDAGAALDWYLTNQVALGADATFGSMKAKDDPGPGVELKAKTTQFGVHGKWLVPTGGKVTPWLGAGIAMYNRKLEASGGGATFDVSDTKPGANFGVGVDYMMSNMVGLGVNGMYDLTFGEMKKDVDGDGIEDKILDNWNYIRFNVALTFHFAGAGAAK